MPHRILAARPRDRQGIALIMTLGVIILLTLAVLTAASNATGNLVHVSLQVYEKQAVRAAEAGLADAVLAIRADPTWRGPVQRALPSNPSASYNVEATNNIAGTGAIAASDGTVVPVGSVYLRSRGQATRGIQRTMTALAVMGSNHVFRYAIFGNTSVALTGSSVVDTWNSNFGPYVAPTTPTVGAIVATNGNSPNSLSIGGNASVDANLYVGPGADPTTAVSGANKATGTVTVSASTVPMPAPSPPPLPPPPYADVKANKSTPLNLAPGTYGNLTASGNATIVLQTGTYVFHNVSLTGGSSLVVPATAGLVKIYFTGTWDTSGGNLVNQTGKAANLVVAGTSTATSAKIAGGADAYFGFYAPTAAVTLVGNSAVFGSVIGASVSIPGNASVHYDQALGANTTFDVRTNWVLTGIHRG